MYRERPLTGDECPLMELSTRGEVSRIFKSFLRNISGNRLFEPTELSKTAKNDAFTAL